MTTDAPFKSVDDSEDAPPPHPGEILREDFLPSLGLSPHALARHLAVPVTEIKNLLGEAAPVTLDLAIRLGAALGQGAPYWLALQMQYDLWHTRRSSAGEVKPLPCLKRWKSRAGTVHRPAA